MSLPNTVGLPILLALLVCQICTKSQNIVTNGMLRCKVWDGLVQKELVNNLTRNSFCALYQL